MGMLVDGRRVGLGVEGMVVVGVEVGNRDSDIHWKVRPLNKV